MPYAKETDFFIAGHFYGNNAPYLFTREDAKIPDFNINLVADISCDVDGPVASTLEPLPLQIPFMGMIQRLKLKWLLMQKTLYSYGS